MKGGLEGPVGMVEAIGERSVVLAPDNKLVVAGVSAKRLPRADQFGRRNDHRDRRQSADRPARRTRWPARQHPDRRRRERGHLRLVGCGECDLQGSEEVIGPVAVIRIPAAMTIGTQEPYCLSA